MVRAASTQRLRAQRPASIKVKARDATGAPVRLNIDGFAARVFQHEFDHLEGVLFPDRMSPEHLKREEPALRALEAAFAAARPREVYQSVLT